MKLRVFAVITFLIAAMIVNVYACDHCPCPPVIEGKVTGGGYIPSINDDPSGKANFGFVAMSENGKLKGSLEFQDDGLNLHSTDITSLDITSNTTATFAGTAEVNHVEGYTYIVYVEDNGEPGVNDVFCTCSQVPVSRLYTKITE